MQRPSPIIKGVNTIQNYEAPELTPAALDKAREYDRLIDLLKVSEKHYENMISLTKSYVGKEMDNPIDFYNKIRQHFYIVFPHRPFIFINDSSMK